LQLSHQHFLHTRPPFIYKLPWTIRLQDRIQHWKGS
jgi:hypothetical protein